MKIIIAMLMLVLVPPMANGSWCKVGDAFYPSNDDRCWVPIDPEKRKSHLAQHGVKEDLPPMTVFYMPSPYDDSNYSADRIRFSGRPVSEGYCRKVASVSGSYSNRMMEICIKSEKKALADLNKMHISASINGYCKKIATITGEISYRMMISCVKSESNAKSRLDANKIYD